VPPGSSPECEPGGVAEYVLGQRCDGLDDVLAAIEHEEHSLLAQKREDDRQRVLRNCHETQLGREHAGEEPRIFDGRKVEEVNGSLKFGEHAVRQCQGDGSFADPTGTDDRYETLLFQLSGELTNDIVATDDQQWLARQLRRSRGCIARSRTRSCPGHLAGKAVAPARYVCDVSTKRLFIAKLLAQSGHMNT